MKQNAKLKTVLLLCFLSMAFSTMALADTEICASGYIKSITFRNVEYYEDYQSITLVLDTTGFKSSNYNPVNITLGHDSDDVKLSAERWRMIMSTVQLALMSRAPIQISAEPEQGCSFAQNLQMRASIVDVLLCKGEGECN